MPSWIIGPTCGVVAGSLGGARTNTPTWMLLGRCRPFEASLDQGLGTMRTCCWCPPPPPPPPLRTSRQPDCYNVPSECWELLNYNNRMFRDFLSVIDWYCLFWNY